MTDYVLFKFHSVNKYLIDGLVNGSIYFSSPNKLNDPFDCRIDIKKAACQAADQLSGNHKEILSKFIAKMDHYLDRIQQDTSNMAVCSFSLLLDNSLMWSHYANHHKGVCLAYEFTEQYLDDPNIIVGIAPVEYKDNSMTTWFINNPLTAETDFQNFTKELLKKALTIKGPDWEYEKEIRLIREEDGPLTIGKDKLKQICFGLAVSESDIKLIRRLVDNAGYTIEYCKMNRNNNDFGIEPNEI